MKKPQPTTQPTTQPTPTQTNRRQFLRQTTLTLPLLHALQPLHAAPPNHHITIDLNPAAIGVKTTNHNQLIQLALRHGYTSITPNLQTLNTMTPTQLQQLKTQLQQHQLQWGSANAPINITADPHTYHTQLQQLPHHAKTLTHIGATRLNTYIPPSHPRRTYHTNFQQWTQRLQQIAPILADHNQRLGLEYIGTHTLLTRHKYPYIHTLAETLDLIQNTNATNIGLILDSWHWWQADDTPQQIRQLKPHQIIAIDLNDAPPNIPKKQQQDNQRELPLATGIINTKTFLTAIRDTHCHAPLRAEPFNQTLNQLNDNDACAATATALKKALNLLN